MASNMIGLDNSKIEDLIAGSRTRNQYTPKIDDFLASDEKAISVRENWPVEFKTKKGSALYQGFITAVKTSKLQDTVRVLKREEEVFLVNREKFELSDED